MLHEFASWEGLVMYYPLLSCTVLDCLQTINLAELGYLVSQTFLTSNDTYSELVDYTLLSIKGMIYYLNY